VRGVCSGWYIRAMALKSAKVEQSVLSVCRERDTRTTSKAPATSSASFDVALRSRSEAVHLHRMRIGAVVVG
jgi:hypothetical protein